MSAKAGLRPVRSLQTSTAGHFPVPCGVKSRASAAPSGVATVTAAWDTFAALPGEVPAAVVAQDARSGTRAVAVAAAMNKRAVRRIIAALPSVDRKNAALDVALAAVDLDRVILAVEVVDHADLAVVGDPGVGIAEVPAAAVVAYDELGAPGLAFVLAHFGADAGRHQAIAVDHHQPPVGQLHQASRRTEVVDPAEELPGPSGVFAREHLGPHDPARIALAAQHAQHPP